MNLSKIHHIAIIVSNYESAKDFYVNKLGFSVIRETTVRSVRIGSWICVWMRTRSWRFLQSQIHRSG